MPLTSPRPGDALPGVINPRHRVEAYSLSGAQPVRLWVHDTANLSYPNGLASNGLTSTLSEEIFVSSWNDHGVVSLSNPSLQGLTQSSRVTYFASHPSAAVDRPADVALLPHPETGPAFAVADYYGKSVQLFTAIPSGPGGSVPTGTPCGTIGVKRRSRMPCLDRPSSLAVQPRGLWQDGDWARLLVAETGGMCVSVFRVMLEQNEELRRTNELRLTSSHLCDICVEQVGSGLHAPQRGLWGWLGVTCAPNGDVVVSDCDNECLLVI